jgi:voltage-gated potassium channel
VAAVAGPAPDLTIPRRAVHPLAALGRRVVVAVAILVLVAAVTYLGRDGYRDVDGSSISFLDAVYYASVTVTTTGYGDITPVSATARAVTSFVVTPARILFLIVLVGTTIEVLTERFREALAEARWRQRVHNHVIVVGYGAKGRGAAATLLAGGSVDHAEVVVIDTQPDALAEASAAGFTTVRGDATRTAVLVQARVAEARSVIVTPARDDTATLVTLTARELNPTATIVAAVRETENAHLLNQSGANAVVVSSEAAGRLLGLSTHQPDAVAVLEDLLQAGVGLELVERPVAAGEAGGPPPSGDGMLPLAIVRAGRRFAFDDPEFATTEAGDVVVYARSEGRAAAS